MDVYECIHIPESFSFWMIEKRVSSATCRCVVVVCVVWIDTFLSANENGVWFRFDAMEGAATTNYFNINIQRCRCIWQLHKQWWVCLYNLSLFSFRIRSALNYLRHNRKGCVYSTWSRNGRVQVLLLFFFRVRGCSWSSGGNSSSCNLSEDFCG